MQYYQQAADLQPTNLRYLSAAAELSYAFGELQETEHLLKQIFTIQGKLLGSEHPDLAQTLNNLGVLRHTQGRHTEAEAFYLWALEICEAHLDARDPQALSLMNNYAACLQEVGRTGEAATFKARAAKADTGEPGRQPGQGVTVNHLSTGLSRLCVSLTHICAKCKGTKGIPGACRRVFSRSSLIKRSCHRLLYQRTLNRTLVKLNFAFRIRPGSHPGKR